MFLSAALSALVQRVKPRTINEVGCGEGYWIIEWSELGINARGSDFSSKVVEIARSNAEAKSIPGSCFSVKSIYELEPELERADLIVCCEVLEHLDDPRKGLAALQRIVTGHLVVSVPREPLWRILNMMRGKYLQDFGNTPGHIQHWTASGFERLIGEHFDILEVRKPMPWTMLLCTPKSVEIKSDTP